LAEAKRQQALAADDLALKPAARQAAVKQAQAASEEQHGDDEETTVDDELELAELTVELAEEVGLDPIEEKEPALASHVKGRHGRSKHILNRFHPPFSFVCLCVFSLLSSQGVGADQTAATAVLQAIPVPRRCQLLGHDGGNEQRRQPSQVHRHRD
jgi:hypothetical protein